MCAGEMSEEDGADRAGDTVATAIGGSGTNAKQQEHTASIKCTNSTSKSVRQRKTFPKLPPWLADGGNTQRGWTNAS
jgi:hypothetical protein